MIVFTDVLSAQIIKVQTGLTFSKLNWEIDEFNTEEYDDFTINYMGMVGVDYFEHRLYNLSSNLGVFNKGGQSEVQYITLNGTETQIEKLRLNYLSFNTCIDLKMPYKDFVIPYISLGPQFDYFIGSSNNDDAILDIESFKKYTLGLILGGGVKFNVEKFQFGVQANYYVEFGDIADYSSDYYGTNLGRSKIQSKLFMLNLVIGYKLN